MTITVSAFRAVPPFAQGLVRDLRVRWALEEAGLSYDARLITQEEKTAPGYRALQPFAQVPAFEEDGFSMFESGAIVLHVAERSEALMPKDPKGRARTMTWVFAALNSIEPRIQALSEIDLFHAGAAWAKERRPQVEAALVARLTDLSKWLDGRDHLEGRFTAGDLMMTTVLRILRHTDILQHLPVLDAYKQRCEARPAFGRALADHMAAFAENAATAA
jgi:glutathione S-transferase